jgi:hypothetical protein
VSLNECTPQQAVSTTFVWVGSASEVRCAT